MAHSTNGSQGPKYSLCSTTRTWNFTALLEVQTINIQVVSLLLVRQNKAIAAETEAPHLTIIVYMRYYHTQSRLQHKVKKCAFQQSAKQLEATLYCLLFTGAFPALQELQLGNLCDLTALMADAVVDLTAVQRLTSLTLERMDGLCVEALTHLLRSCRQLVSLRVRGCDGICQEDMEHIAQCTAAACGSSATLAWAASPSCDTDDEEDGWEVIT